MFLFGKFNNHTDSSAESDSAPNGVSASAIDIMHNIFSWIFYLTVC